MKKNSVATATVSSLLLFSFLISMAGIFTSYLTVFHRQSFQEQVRTERASEAQQLQFSELDFASIAWAERGTEFEFNGKLYDVSAIAYKDGIYTITCENDLVEELLLDFLKSPGGKTKNKTPQLQLSVPEEIFSSESTSVSCPRERSFYSDRLVLVGIQRTTPPPRFS